MQDVLRHGRRPKIAMRMLPLSVEPIMNLKKLLSFWKRQVFLTDAEKSEKVFLLILLCGILMHILELPVGSKVEVF